MKEFLRPTGKKIAWFILIPSVEYAGVRILAYILEMINIADWFGIVILIQIVWLFMLGDIAGLSIWQTDTPGLVSWTPPNDLGFTLIVIGSIITLLLYYLLACWVVKKYFK